MLKLLKSPNITKSVNKYLVTLLILFIPLYPKFPLFTVPGSSVAVRLEDFVVLFALLIWVFFNASKIKSLLRIKITHAVLLFFLVGLLSVLSGVFLTNTIDLQLGVFHLVRRMQYILPLFIGMTAVSSKEDLHYYIKLLGTVIVFALVYGIGQKYLHLPIITTQNSEYAKGVALFYLPGAHLVSTFAGHYDLANFLVLISPLFVMLAAKQKKILYILFLVGIFLASLWLLVNAASRISVVTFMGSIILGLLLIRKYLWIPLIIIISFLFILTSSNLMDRYVRIFRVAAEQALTTVITPVYAQDGEVYEDRSTSIRLNVEWPRALRAFEKNPLLGTGYSSITLATDNDYLRMLGEIGAIGTLSFFLIFARIFEQIRKSKNIFVLAITAAIPGIMLNMVFIDILEASKFALMFWLLIGIAISAVIFENGKKNFKNN